MGWRFRKSFKIFPGMKINVNKKSVGITFGGKGIHYTINSKGKHTASAGIPGTGLYYTKSATTGKSKKQFRTSYHNENKKNRKGGKFFVVILIFIFLLSAFVLRKNPSSFPKENTNNERVPAYSDSEILNFDGHPQIYSDFEKTEKFYLEKNIENVAITDIPHFSRAQMELKSFSDDNTLIYFIQSATHKEFVDSIQINIFNTELYEQSTLDSMVALVMSYLPDNFLEFYKIDAAFQYSGNDTTTYTCSFRLNESGIAYQNSGHFEYSYFYYFEIIHRPAIHRWTIETGVSAYGGKGLEWINKYAQPWEINLNY